MSRLPPLVPTDLDAEQKRLYASITSRRGRGPQLFELIDNVGGLTGPFNAMLLSPAIGEALQNLGGTIRYDGQLTDRCREIAILAVAAHWKSGFEQRAHEPIAAHAGITQAQIAAIRGASTPALEDPEEAASLRTVWSLLSHGGLDDAEYEGTVSLLGTEKLFELSTLVGYYSLLALQMRVFAVD